jgi:hypothetical protein
MIAFTGGRFLSCTEMANKTNKQKQDQHQTDNPSRGGTPNIREEEKRVAWILLTPSPGCRKIQINISCF